MNHIFQILVPNLEPLDYLAPPELELKIGNLVIVPVRSKKVLGIVWKINSSSEFPIEKLRYIEQKLSLEIADIDLKFIRWVANYYMYNLGHVFKMLIPSAIANFIAKDKPYKLSNTSQPLTYSKPEFNSEQVNAINQIKELIQQKKYNIILDGVTGSGKTEVYLAAINEALLEANNAQILIILPEISLTNQLIDRITSRFGIKPDIWHSNILGSKKRDSFLKIIHGDAQIIIGARSALFLPYKNLSMIIVDEEHDNSYKQEDGVSYHARDMALMRGSLANIPVILASASPSLESIYNVALGKLNIVTLSARYNNNAMPEVTIIDMKKNRKKNSFISPILFNSLEKNLLDNQQSLIFLNRKGYSPAMICRGCGYRICCKSCSTGMVYHKAQKKLKCHQCGYVAGLPKICPHCQKEDSFIPYGPGIEKLEEEIRDSLPQAKIICITQDSFNNLNETQQLIDSIINKEYDIIIGTQIIAKGHHFPSLTLVGVIDADLWGIGGDLRAAEKTYQLLQQVGGRAGREINGSKIFIQTYNPEHPLILALASYNRAKFIEEEMRTRKEMHMPPFGRLASIIISSNREDKLIEFSQHLIKQAPNNKQISVLGPAPAIIYKLRGKFRYRFLVKTSRNINIQKFLQAWLDSIQIPNHIHLKIDIDPYYFL